jgi:predicted RNA-binding protein YlxR (DUF448 family)
VGCGSIAPQDSLHRLALRGGAVVLDERRRLPGRGAYVCNATCARRAEQSRAFARAFRRTVPGPSDFIDSLI